MGLGILDTHPGIEVLPGTVVLAEKEAHSEELTKFLKHGKGRYAHIVLSPQPSDDPNDPLNWPMIKKWALVATLALGAATVAGTIGPLLNASLFLVANEFDRPIGDIAIVAGYQLLVAASSAPFISVISRKFGKRPVFLLASFLPLTGTIVGSASNTYTSLLTARIVQGFGAAAYESLIFSVHGDLFFVHERGYYNTIQTFVLNCSSILASVVTGPISDSLGWRYLFHILIAVLGLQLLLVFFLVPETTYHRPANDLVQEVLAVTTEGTFSDKNESIEKEVHFATLSNAVEQSTAATPTNVPAIKTYIQSLAIYTGVHSNESWLSLFVGPFIACTNIGALWSIVVSGGLTSFFVGVSFLPAQLFSIPPYNLTTAGVGYTSIGPFIGGTLGCAFLGLLIDPLAVFLSRRNCGVYEPEFRLPLGLLGLISAAGFFAFGYTAQYQMDIYLICFVWGVALFGVCITVGVSITYALDAYRTMSNEIFLANIMFKNFLFYGYTYFVNQWTAKNGPRDLLYTFAGVNVAMVLTVVPMYVWGKRSRAFWHKHNIFEKLGVQTHEE
ncbi:major facilitator superfamily domain-containing protein [Pyrenochaeta sp. MPI-SDFR-AT-0127]|nr:major facilitator superfamily domain-containing protein [Pyrenochaeta sp. MPI-SDFR-AT-0127]